jgi:hypothetical protein
MSEELEYLRMIAENTAGQRRDRQDEDRNNQRRHRQSVAAIRSIASPVTKILNLISDQIVKLDEANALYSDMLVDTTKLTGLLNAQGPIVGTGLDHMKITMDLRKQGLAAFSQRHKNFRQFIHMERAAGLNAESVIGAVGRLASTGASQKTLAQVFDKIADVAQNTAQTADATIASLTEVAGIGPMLRVLGIEGDIYEGVVEAGKGMTTEQQLILGKFVKQLISPDDITKALMLGGVDFGDQLLNARGPKEVQNIIQEAAQHMGDLSEDMVSMGRGSVVTLDTMRDVIGSLGEISLQVRDNFKSAEEASKLTDQHITEGADQADRFRSSIRMALGEDFEKQFQTIAGVILGEFQQSEFFETLKDPTQFRAMLDGITDDIIPAIRNGADKIFDLVDAIAELVYKIQNPFSSTSLAESKTMEAASKLSLQNVEASNREIFGQVQTSIDLIGNHLDARLSEEQLGILTNILKDADRGLEIDTEQLEVMKGLMENFATFRRIIQKQKGGTVGTPNSFFRDSLDVEFK